MRKPNRFLHRMGFIFSPSLLYMGVGAYNNRIAKRNWRKFEDRVGNAFKNAEEDDE